MLLAHDCDEMPVLVRDGLNSHGLFVYTGRMATGGYYPPLAMRFSIFRNGGIRDD